MPANQGTPTGTFDRRASAGSLLPRPGTSGAVVLGACWLLPAVRLRLGTGAGTATAACRAPRRPPAQTPAGGMPVIGTPLPGMRIVAVVNGDVITSGDVENRARLFALSTGLPTSPDVHRPAEVPDHQPTHR